MPALHDSKLAPFRDFILESRQRTNPLSYEKIAKALEENYGFKTTKASVHNFVKSQPDTKTMRFDEDIAAQFLHFIKPHIVTFFKQYKR